MSFNEHLSPTKEALVPALRRAQFQAMVWHQDIQAVQTLPSPRDFGWTKTGENMEPVPSTKPCAPEFLMEIIKCSCKLKKCTQGCSCRKNDLECTEMCMCNADPETCENLKTDSDEDDDEEHFDGSSSDEDD